MLTDLQLNKLNTYRLLNLLKSIRFKIIGTEKFFNEKLDGQRLKELKDYFSRIKMILSKREHVERKKNVLF